MIEHLLSISFKLIGYILLAIPLPLFLSLFFYKLIDKTLIGLISVTYAIYFLLLLLTLIMSCGLIIIGCDQA